MKARRTFAKAESRQQYEGSCRQDGEKNPEKTEQERNKAQSNKKPPEQGGFMKSGADCHAMEAFIADSGAVSVRSPFAPIDLSATTMHVFIAV